GLGGISGPPRFPHFVHGDGDERDHFAARLQFLRVCLGVDRSMVRVAFAVEEYLAPERERVNSHWPTSLILQIQFERERVTGPELRLADAYPPFQAASPLA